MPHDQCIAQSLRIRCPEHRGAENSALRENPHEFTTTDATIEVCVPPAFSLFAVYAREPDVIRTTTLLGMLVAACTASCCQTSDASDIDWLDDVDRGWQVTVRKDRPMLLYVTRDGCKYCVKMERGTYRDDRITTQVNESFVPVMIDASVADRVLKNIEVSAYPTTLVISPDAVLLDRIKGYLSPQKMAQRLDAAQQQQGVPARR